MKAIKTYGLIGFPLTHSFSFRFFGEKFDREQIPALYRNFELERIEQFEDLISNNRIAGLNVTIPYKQSIMTFLDEIDDTASAIGAVNVIKFIDRPGLKPLLRGYNSDSLGFGASLDELIVPGQHNQALVLGTGGASKAVEYALRQRGIDVQFVSRKPEGKQLSYRELNSQLIQSYTLIINCTPLGTYPHTDTFPDIPYEGIGTSHLLYDLVYNPAQTLFLAKGKAQGAAICNGEKMLILQAEEAWRIWNSDRD